MASNPRTPMTRGTFLLTGGLLAAGAILALARGRTAYPAVPQHLVERLHEAEQRHFGPPTRPPPPPPYEEVATFSREEDATSAVRLLEAAGIPTSLVTDECGGLEEPIQPGSPIRLLVPLESIREADEILKVAAK